MDCPYLDGRLERRLFVELSRSDGQAVFEQLSRHGFRRSRNMAYRPACPSCNRCLSARVPTDGFQERRSFRRIRQRNRDLVPHHAGHAVGAEHYALFRRYVQARHGGEMARMTGEDFACMTGHSPVAGGIMEWRDGGGRLWAACLTDRLQDGLSAVTSYFEPDAPRRSLGSFMILSLLDRARALGLAYVYLGYLVPGSAKMAYKARFRPLQVCGPAGWVLWQDGEGMIAGRSGGESEADTRMLNRRRIGL